MRDEFSKNTKRILAQRSGYYCNHPLCQRTTSGPHVDPNKATISGTAAHISAASKGGPRFNVLLTNEQRKDISNAIWLCLNCAYIIDEDKERYPDTLLLQWKTAAEDRQHNRMLSSIGGDFIPKRPIIEADLIYHGNSRRPFGSSLKNPHYVENGTIIIDTGFQPPILFWELHWGMLLVLQNSSSVAAFNLSIEMLSERGFNKLPNLPKLNNIQPYNHLDIPVEYNSFMESTYDIADAALEHEIPKKLEGMKFKLKYLDVHKNVYSTLISIQNNQVVNDFNLTS